MICLQHRNVTNFHGRSRECFPYGPAADDEYSKCLFEKQQLSAVVCWPLLNNNILLYRNNILRNRALLIFQDGINSAAAIIYITILFVGF